MTSEFVITFGRQAIMLAAELAGPLLIAALLIGLLISIFQAVTQIQEMTLAIIPKMMVVLLVLVIFFPWFLTKASAFMELVFTNFPIYIGLG